MTEAKPATTIAARPTLEKRPPLSLRQRLEETSDEIVKRAALKRKLAKEAVRQVQALERKRVQRETQQVDEDARQARAAAAQLAHRVRQFWSGCVQVVQHAETERVAEFDRQRRIDSLEVMVSRTEKLSHMMSSQLRVVNGLSEPKRRGQYIEEGVEGEDVEDSELAEQGEEEEEDEEEKMMEEACGSKHRTLEDEENEEDAHKRMAGQGDARAQDFTELNTQRDHPAEKVKGDVHGSMQGTLGHEAGKEEGDKDVSREEDRTPAAADKMHACKLPVANGHTKSVEHQKGTAQLLDRSVSIQSRDGLTEKAAHGRVADDSAREHSRAKLDVVNGGSGCVGTLGVEDDKRRRRSRESMESSAQELSEETAFDRRKLTQHITTEVPVLLLRHPLREYQHVGLHWLATLHDRGFNGILADEMGLGKTIMTIALMAHLVVMKNIWGPHLVIVPTSVQLNWEMEFKKWAPGLKILSYYGTAAERKRKRVGWQGTDALHVCIASYHVVLQDLQVFRRKRWYYMVLDEAQHIKNFRSRKWQELIRFHTARRLLLTGTPLQNNLMELWSLMHFLMPNVFESYYDFKEWFSDPLNLAIQNQSVEKEGGLIARLHGVLRPFMLRRLKSEVEKQMPSKHEHVVVCPLARRQEVLYEEFMRRRETRRVVKKGDYFGMMNILMQLRKVCNHPDLFEPRHAATPFTMASLEVVIPGIVLLALWCAVGGRQPGEENFCSFLLPLIALFRYEVARLRSKRLPQSTGKHVQASDIVQKRRLGGSAASGVIAMREPHDLLAMRRATLLAPDKREDCIYVSTDAAPSKRRLMARRMQVLQERHDQEVVAEKACPMTQTESGWSKKTVSFLAEARRQFAHENSERRRKHVLDAAFASLVLEEIEQDRPLWGADGLELLSLHCDQGDCTGSPMSRSITLKEKGQGLRGLRPRRRWLGAVERVDAGEEHYLGYPASSSSSSSSSSLCSSSPSAALNRLRRCSYHRSRRWWEEGGAVASLCGCVRDHLEVFGPTELGAFAFLVPRACVLPQHRRTLCWPIDDWVPHGVRAVGAADPCLAHARLVPSCCSEAQSLARWQRMEQDELIASRRFHAACSNKRTLPLLNHLGAQLRCHLPEKHHLESDCAKLTKLGSMLHDFRRMGSKCVIFTQFSKMLDILESYLDYQRFTYLRLDGSVKVERRQGLVDRFNADERVFIFLSSTRAGGVGINLTGANVVIFYDSDWNPAMDRQATDRAHRIGQTREVHIYRLLSEHTVEQNIWRRQLQKRQLDDAVVDKGRFDTQTLHGLGATHRTSPWTLSEVRSIIEGDCPAAPRRGCVPRCGDRDARVAINVAKQPEALAPLPATPRKDEAESGSFAIASSLLADGASRDRRVVTRSRSREEPRRACPQGRTAAVTSLEQALLSAEDPVDAELAEVAIQENERALVCDFGDEEPIADSGGANGVGDAGSEVVAGDLGTSRPPGSIAVGDVGGEDWRFRLPPLVRLGVERVKMHGVGEDVRVPRSTHANNRPTAGCRYDLEAVLPAP